MTHLAKRVHHAAHRAGTARATRKVNRLHKTAAFDDMLSPRFVPRDRTTRQELTAGIIAGVLVLVFLVVMLAFGFPSIGGLFDKPSTAIPIVHKPAPLIAQQTYLRLTLKNWRNSAGGPSFKAYPGFHYIVVNVAIQHKYAVPTWLAPSLQSYVMDQAGQQYQLTPDDEITNPLVAKQYAPGEIASGQLAYEIPDSAKQPAWCYDLNRGTNKSAPLCINLN